MTDGPRITFLGGVNEIGGNKIVVEDGNDRILFDFGPSFSPRFEDFYVNYLRPRKGSFVKDLLEFDLLPRIAGLYSKDALTDSDLPYEEPRFAGVFLTHAHADHARYLHLIDPDIPIFAGEGTHCLLDAIGATGDSYGEHTWSHLPERQPIQVGPFEVTAFPVDHSIPWAYGYLVRTRQGTVVYTGDFRHHGPRAEDTHGFLEAARRAEPCAFVTEGTRAGPDPRKNCSEQEVRNGVDEVLADCRELALACTYPRDIDRLLTLYAAARAADRELVISVKTAHLLTAIADRFPGAPRPGKSAGLRVYGRKKRMTYLWERPFLEDCLRAEEVRRDGARYLLLLDLAHFAELIDLRPAPKSPFIHSMSEPFSEDDVDDRVFQNWIRHFDLVVAQLHASGHCSSEELGAIARAVHARTIFPIHTEHPEAFTEFGPPVVAPEKGRAYAL